MRASLQEEILTYITNKDENVEDDSDMIRDNTIARTLDFSPMKVYQKEQIIDFSLKVIAPNTIKKSRSASQ